MRSVRSIVAPLRAEEATALPAVLAVVTVLTVLAGTVLAVFAAQYRFIRRDVHRLQARYLAEAAVYVALDSLQRNPLWRTDRVVVALPGEATAEVAVAAFGGYVLVRAVAQRRRSRFTLRAFVGEVPPVAFRNALYVWDTASSLNVAGTTVVRGDVVVGGRGVETSAYKGRSFRGVVDGAVFATPDLAPPFFDVRPYDDALAWLEARLVPGVPPDPEAVSHGEAPYVAARHLPADNPVLWFDGDARVTAADQPRFERPVTVAAAGRLVVEGPLRFEPGTVFAAAGDLVVEGAVAGRGGLFYGRTGVEVGPGVDCAAQVFSRSRVRVYGDAYLRYPSLLYVAGDAAEQGGAVELADSAVVDGLVLHPPLDPRPAAVRGRVVLQRGTRVRGAVFNALETEVHGIVDGTLLTHRLYFYDAPTSYVNWLLDAAVAVGERPASFAVPLGFSEAPRLAVLAWESHVEERTP